MMKSLLATTAFSAAVTCLSAAECWEDPNVNAIARQPARAYSMPLADAQAALTDALEPETPYRKSLNGTWRIFWCGTPDQKPAGFEQVDFDDSKWNAIDVPSCVEMRGFGSPNYTNIRYPHQKKPPFIGTEYNPVSSYRLRFTVPEGWRGRDVFLRFDGVYSCHWVWVNGHKVGYSEDSKLPSEFDVTKYLVPGENVLAVQVYRWCDGSYLEDQDMFRFSGIFRDVTLFATPKVRLDDFCVKTAFSADRKDATLELKTTVRGGKAPVSATLYDAAFAKVGEAFTVSTLVKGVHPWSAEDPYLYTLVMKAGEDVRACRVGFRDVKIDGKRVLFNGKPIKFKGVNRHESNPENGRTVSLADMLADVRLFKRYNVNTVRTSHYPDHHTWYDLCDKYGIYVMAEANVEAHDMGYFDEGLGRIPAWRKSIVERNENNVLNYRNHASVAFWSLGNETAHGSNFVAAVAAVKALDPIGRPVHWERGCPAADVDSRMYPTVEWLRERGEIGDGLKDPGPDTWTKVNYHTKGKPFFMCEYAHAMGNAMGNFAEYWDAFYSSESLCGGCIWDWIDQAVWKPTDRVDAQGKRVRVLAYGGDFDVKPNDGPFCCNGVVGPLREVTPKLLEVAHVHRNLVVTSADAASGKAELWNRFGFTPANAYDGRWALYGDGIEVASGTLPVPSVAPLSRAALDLPQPAGFAPVPGVEYFYVVSFHEKQATRWAEKGWCVASDQLPWKNAAAAQPRVVASAARPVVTEDAKEVVVRMEGVEARFCRRTGTAWRLEMGGTRIFEDEAGVVHGPQLTVARAFTDNDIWMRAPFYESGLSQLRYHPQPLAVAVAADGSACVTCATVVNGSKSGGFRHVAEWRFRCDGSVEVKNAVDPFGKMPVQLPRLGTTWRLDSALENVTWYGRGPEENYVDRNTGSFIGLYSSTVKGQYVDYVRPQDCGYKSDVRWAAFTDASGNGVLIKGASPFFMQALHYGWEDLEFARHRNGQERIWAPPAARREIVLNLDCRQCGLGGGSCGPKPMEKYLFPAVRTTWSVTLKPVKSGPFAVLGFGRKNTPEDLAALARE